MKKKTTLLTFLFVLIASISFVTNSCKKDDTSGPISDVNFYRQIGTTLIHCINDIYNQNLAGRPTGTQNINVNGPMGGTVLITGTDSYDNTHGITTTDLVLSMTNVSYTYSSEYSTTITLTGPITYTGSFSNSYTSINHQSANLQITGSVTKDGTDRNIDMTGEVSINRSSSITVNIFGNIVTW